MAIATLRAGQTVILKDHPHRLTRMISDTEWQLENQQTGRITTLSTTQFWELYNQGDITFVLDESLLRNRLSETDHTTKQIAALDMLPEEKAELARIRLHYVKAIRNANCEPATLTIIINDTWKQLKKPEKPPYWTTVHRWRTRYEKAGMDIRALVSRDQAKGNRQRRYSTELLDFVAQAVESIYLRPEKSTIQDTLDHAIAMVARENKLRPASERLPMPTRSLIKSAISTISPYDRDVKRLGPMAARHNYRSVQHNSPASRPLERVEIDHTILDLIVVHDELRLPLGRPTLTICIDSATRCILGYYLGFDKPSYLTVAKCLQHAFLPKTYLKQRYPNIRSDWECFGVMETLAVDNGYEFHSKHLESLCYSLGSDILFTPRKTPWYKGSIERVIGTLNRGVAHPTRGTTFADILQKGDYDPIKTAVVSLSELDEAIHTWIVDYYHQKLHRTLNQSPISLWRAQINPDLQHVPLSAGHLEALLGATEIRKLTHTGIQLHNLFYNSSDLRELRKECGPSFEVSIRYDTNDIGSIHVLHPKTNEPIKVNAVDYEYANRTTLWLHNLIKRHARLTLVREDIEALAETKEYIRGISTNEMTSKRLKTRMLANRAAQSFSTPVGTQEGDIPIEHVSVYGNGGIPKPLNSPCAESSGIPLKPPDPLPRETQPGNSPGLRILKVTRDQ